MSESLLPIRSVHRLTADEADEIIIEGYHYLFPLVLMHLTRRFCTNQPLGTRPGVGPEDMFHHVREFNGLGEPNRPNFDMLQSSAWIDVSMGPRAISVPATEGRYYIMALYDMWTDAFAVIGTHTTGSGPGRFMLVPLDWDGPIDNGVTRVRAPTTHVWISLQIQTRGPRDYPAVHQLQDCFTIDDLSGKDHFNQKIDPAVDTYTHPRDQVQAMTGCDFFRQAADFMKTDRPHNTDWSIVARMRRIGLKPGQPFHFKKSPVAVQARLDQAVGEARQRMAWKTKSLAPVVNGWQLDTISVGVYGNDYLKRAVLAGVSLCALPSEEAIFCTSFSITESGVHPDTDRFLLHFNREAMPPVNAFWSLTLYDPEGFPARTTPNRIIIRDSRDLGHNLDGSVDIIIQKQQPDVDKLSNWLPLSDGQAVLTMRLYSPRPEALDGRWVPPAMQRLNS